MTAGQRSAPAIRSYHHREFSLDRLLAGPRPSVSVCLPARNEASTIGGILEALQPLREAGLLDQVAVIDRSADATATVARQHGAEVYDQAQLRPDMGPAAGKGDAMWRALSVLRGEIVCFLDADSGDFGAHYVRGLLGPLLCEPGAQFVKAFYRRPFRVGELTLPEGGGRVTELTARPLLGRFFPELAEIRQPLAGEMAARRELLEQLPFATGYGVDIGLLLDAYALAGAPAIAQVDLDVRQNAHQPLADLGPMARAVLDTVLVRLSRQGRLVDPAPGPGPGGERPPISQLRCAA